MIRCESMQHFSFYVQMIQDFCMFQPFDIFSDLKSCTLFIMDLKWRFAFLLAGPGEEVIKCESGCNQGLHYVHHGSFNHHRSRLFTTLDSFIL